ncbi:MAG: threonine--tRNA ligase, partial [Candidatus Omnitrophica bacterium]|nr:threonine--tRNA ligase [Candidatus Omnitrophota bacterium]
CDFALPERFDLKYTDQDGKENRPIVLHRVILGSLERFIGALVEHYGGDFPLWLAPIQVKIVPISEDHVDYGGKIEKLLQEQGFRVEIDTRDEKMQKKIRTAELSKIPYTVVVGKKEKSADTVALRNRKTGEITVMGQKELLEFLKEEIASKK